MKTLYLSIMVILVPILMLAQDPQVITLDNNKTTANVVNPELQYLFPEFRDGNVTLKKGKPIKCKLNYNFMTDEMLFIDEKGSKMALANPEDILSIYIGNRMFIPVSKAYYEVIEKAAISLVYKWTTNITEIGKDGVLGIVTDAPSVYQMNQMSFDNRTWKLDVDKKAVVTVVVVPYLLIKSKCVRIQGWSDFAKAFPGKKSEIKLYLDQNPVDYKKEADLRRLTKFCNSL
jgi:hypothetical protein